MKRILLTATLLLIIISVVKAQDNDNTERLWYDKPANIWLEALPIGNGRLGGMVYGGTQTDEIQLNEGTFWSGGPHNNNSTTALAHLDEVRRLIFNGQEQEAEDLLNQEFVKGPHGMKFLTLGSLKMIHEGIAAERVTNFQRELDLQTALSTVTFDHDGHHYSRTTFASMPDSIIVMRLTADVRSSFAISHSAPYPSTYDKSEEGIEANIQGAAHEGIAAQLKASLRYQVESDGEVTYAADGTVEVKDYTWAVVYISAATNYVNYHDVTGNQTAKSLSYLTAARQHDYAELLNRHLEAYQEQYDRVHLHLPSVEANAKMTTEKRLEAFAGSSDWGMIALMFNYGRYLLISSSQKGGQAATLQGLWNDKKDPMWDSKYTININTEMNYWPSEVCNLSETNVPLFEMIRDLSVTGAETAQTMYGCGGWMAHHNTDLWRIAGPVDGAFWGIYPNGGAWLATHLWQHYLFTGDVDFLREWYPVIKGTADFYMDFMVPIPDGSPIVAGVQSEEKYNWRVVAPSMSPEQGPAGKTTAITAGCTMDNQIAFDALSNTLRAAEILGEDPSYISRLTSTISQLPPMQIGSRRQLQEWLIDADGSEPQHRHISHLYGLFPSNQISPYRHNELFAAARQTLMDRGEEATGWSLGWKICFWARMQNGNHALSILKNLLKLLPDEDSANKYPDGRTFPNLFDAHPPFQIDGNFGATAGIAEMLLQSHDGAIHILPSLPTSWKEGQVTGLKARGGFEIDMAWKGNTLSEMTLHSSVGGTARIRSFVELERLRAGDDTSGMDAFLQPAEGDCPNPLYAPSQIKEPLLSPSLTSKPSASVRKVYEYDVQTVAGEDYHFVKKGSLAISETSRTITDNSVNYYDLLGRPTTKDAKGIIIEKRLENGKSSYKKIIPHVMK